MDVDGGWEVENDCDEDNERGGEGEGEGDDDGYEVGLRED